MLAACGTVHAGAVGPGGTPPAATPASAVITPVTTSPDTRGPTTWRTFPELDVSHIALADSGRVLLVAAPLPPQTSACLRDLTSRLTGFTSAVADITITFKEPVSGPNAMSCPLGASATIRIALPAPLGNRQVVLNRTQTFWLYHSTTQLTICGSGGTPCQPVPTAPPPAGCNDESYSWARGGLDVPKHADYNAVGCDGHWLVLDVGWPGGPVGCDGPSCAGGSTTEHWFFQASTHGWIAITNSLTAGCTRVHQAAPQFPTSLCQNLPAEGPYAAQPTGTSST
jgi:hypothetical protein